jgi:hypothetical protein
LLIEVPPEQWGYRHRLYNQQWANPVPPGDWDNKILFVTAGQTSDQYAVKLDNSLFFSSMGYRDSRTGGVGMALGVTVKGPTGDRSITLAHTAVRRPGWDTLTSSMRADDWMVKRGPAYQALISGVGVYPDGVTRFTPDLGWYDPESPALGALGYEDANKIWNPARQWPYGGYPTDGTVAWPDTGSNGRNGPSMIPSRAFHRASGANGATTDADDSMLFKMQENAIDENRSNCGFMIVGALDGFPEPTSTSFHALRAQPPGSGSANKLIGQYVAIAVNKGANPGTVHNWGGGLVMGFAKGELAGAAYRPAQTGKNWQYAILRTSFTGQTITTVNAYDPLLGSVTAPVHRFDFANPLPVVPRARSADYIGDCFNVIFNKELQRPLGRQLKYGQVIYSMSQIPFPGHLDKPLPWPEPWT